MSIKKILKISIAVLSLAIVLFGGYYQPLGAEPSAGVDASKKSGTPAVYARPAFLSGTEGTAEVLAAVKKEYGKDPGLIGTHLKSRLNALLNSPERLDLSAEGLKFAPENNDISYETISINLKNALFDALNVETASIDIKNISFDAFALFAQGRLRVLSQQEIAAHINVAEDDLNAYLKNKAEKIKVRKPYVRFAGEKLVLGGTFKYGIFVIKFDATGIFKIVEDTKVHFDIKRLEVNQMRMPSNFVRKVILKINPIMDLEKFPFKLVMKTIAVSGKHLIFSSKQVIK